MPQLDHVPFARSRIVTLLLPTMTSQIWFLALPPYLTSIADATGSSVTLVGAERRAVDAPRGDTAAAPPLGIPVLTTVAAYYGRRVAIAVVVGLSVLSAVLFWRDLRDGATHPSVPTFGECAGASATLDPVNDTSAHRARRTR